LQTSADTVSPRSGLLLLAAARYASQSQEKVNGERPGRGEQKRPPASGPWRLPASWACA